MRYPSCLRAIVTRRRATSCLLLVLLLSESGCYLERTVPLGALSLDNQVRVRLTPAGARSLATTVGEGATAISGSLLERDDSTLTLAVRRVERADGATEWRGERASVPLGAVEGVSVSHLDATRTVLAGLAVAVGGYLLHAAFQNSERAGGGTGGGPIGAQ